MKKKIILTIAIVMLITTIFSTLIACSSKVSNEDCYEAIKKACEESKKANQYYSKYIEGPIEYNFNLWADDSSTENIDETRFQFVKIDNSNIAKTEYTYYYFGPTIPTKEKDLKNVKIMFFNNDDKNIPGEEISYQEAVEKEKIYLCLMEIIVDSIEGINSTNSEIVYSKKQGRVTEIILHLNEKINTKENSIDIYNKEQSKEKLGVYLRITNGKISTISVAPLTKANKIDEKEKAIFTIQISYRGPNLKIKDMPHYDEYGK